MLIGKRACRGCYWLYEVTKDSIGFNSNELVIGHTVWWPTAILADEWQTSKPPENVVDYVSGFRWKLYEAQAVAQKKLCKSQTKMQQLFKLSLKDLTV